VWPKPENIFKAYELCSPEEVNVVIIGQDPYPNEHAHGLAFSTTQLRRPVSLHNIFKEVCRCSMGYDIEKDFPTNNLTSWAKQGILLLNSVLTVREGFSNSHKDLGWETFTGETIRRLYLGSRPVIFVVWGQDAINAYTRALGTCAGNPIHGLLHCGHPASGAYGIDRFVNNRHFSTVNYFLQRWNRPDIVWKTSGLQS
jgi:uracil-DNA glycosylase